MELWVYAMVVEEGGAWTGGRQQGRKGGREGGRRVKRRGGRDETEAELSVLPGKPRVGGLGQRAQGQPQGSRQAGERARMGETSVGGPRLVCNKRNPLPPHARSTAARQRAVRPWPTPKVTVNLDESAPAAASLVQV